MQAKENSVEIVPPIVFTFFASVALSGLTRAVRKSKKINVRAIKVGPYILGNSHKI